jgi:choline dehydrogenase-like flavoprotein
MQIKRSPEIHDVIVIGSGAAGGMAAWNLTQKGVNVLVLDAGEKFDRAKFWSHVKPWEWQPRIARGQRSLQFYLDLKDQPYTWEEGHYFQLTRVWGRGGKTNVWGRVSLRYSDLNFTEPERVPGELMF